MKNILIIILGICLVALGVYAFFVGNPFYVAKVDDNNSTVTSVATSTEENNIVETDKTKTVIGKSVNGENITAYHFGEGEKEILFIAGVHGGYGWNTTLLANQVIDYLKSDKTLMPENLKVTIIPVLNPDGLKKVTGSPNSFTVADVSSSEEVVVSGRFNSNNVDLNRNFDCDWKSTGIWQTKTVSGGSTVFSEPESKAIKEYVEKNKITAAVVWYSAAGGVFASSCHNGVSPETSSLTKTFATASGYKSYESFDFYTTTGDMVNWFAKNNIPAISVLLTNHTDTEFDKNKKGVEAVLKYYSK